MLSSAQAHRLFSFCSSCVASRRREAPPAVFPAHLRTATTARAAKSRAKRGVPRCLAPLHTFFPKRPSLHQGLRHSCWNRCFASPLLLSSPASSAYTSPRKHTHKHTGARLYTKRATPAPARLDRRLLCKRLVFHRSRLFAACGTPAHSKPAPPTVSRPRRSASCFSLKRAPPSLPPSLPRSSPIRVVGPRAAWRPSSRSPLPPSPPSLSPLYLSPSSPPDGTLAPPRCRLRPPSVSLFFSVAAVSASSTRRPPPRNPLTTIELCDVGQRAGRVFRCRRAPPAKAHAAPACLLPTPPYLLSSPVRNPIIWHLVRSCACLCVFVRLYVWWIYPHAAVPASCTCVCVYERETEAETKGESALAIRSVGAYPGGARGESAVDLILLFLLPPPPSLLFRLWPRFPSFIFFFLRRSVVRSLLVVVSSLSWPSLHRLAAFCV